VISAVMDVIAKSAYGFALLYFRLYFDKKLAQSGINTDEFAQFSKDAISKNRPAEKPVYDPYFDVGSPRHQGCYREEPCYNVYPKERFDDDDYADLQRPKSSTDFKAYAPALNEGMASPLQQRIRMSKQKRQRPRDSAHDEEHNGYNDGHHNGYNERDGNECYSDEPYDDDRYKEQYSLPRRHHAPDPREMSREEARYWQDERFDRRQSMHRVPSSGSSIGRPTQFNHLREMMAESKKPAPAPPSLYSSRGAESGRPASR